MKGVLREPEAELQEAIEQVLTLEQFFVVPFGKPGGHRELKGTCPEGWPDIQAIKQGRHIFFECKAEGGSPTFTQNLTHQRLRAEGCVVYVVHSVGEVLDALQREGYKLRTSRRELT